MLPSNLFDHLRPIAKTYEHVMTGVHIPASNPKPVVLHLVYCGKGTPYWNAIMKFKPLADDTAAAKRASDKFAQLGVTGWANVENDGKPVPFTPELAAHVFEQLIDANRPEKVERAILVAMEPANFEEPAAGRDAELGKR